MKRQIVFMLFCLSVILSFGQKSVMTEGKIVYDISYPELNVITSSALPSEAVMIFKNNKVKLVYDFALMKTMVLTNEQQTNAVVYMDMMGSKISIPITNSDIDSRFRKSVPSVTLLKDKKIIAGFKCQHALIKNLSINSKGPYEVWYTDAINTRNGVGSNINGINGVMLEYYMVQNNLLMKMTARQILAVTVNENEFASPEGYKQTSIDQIMKYQREN